MKVLLLNDYQNFPTKGSSFAAGFDVKSPISIDINPGETTRIPLSIAIEINNDEVAMMSERSSMGIKGIHSFANIIDADYRGEISIVLYNSSKEIFKIEKGDRIGQIVVLKIAGGFVEGVNKLSETKRGDGGFGSSGK